MTQKLFRYLARDSPVMILKIFKAVWFLSLLLLLGIFMYVYASLGQEVSLGEGGMASLSREAIFYVLIVLIAFVNAAVFVFSRLVGDGRGEWVAWFYGLVVTLNLFFIAVMAYLNVVNSGEKYDFARLGILINSSLGITIAWMVGWPVYTYARRLFSKQSV